MSKTYDSILIIGDSLAAKRGDGIEWDGRWPQLLSHLVGGTSKVINASRRASTSERLRERIASDSSLVIIQLGIVDCVPRYFTIRENKLLSKTPRWARGRVIEFFTSRRTQDVKRAYVTEERYHDNYKTFLDRYLGDVIIIKILEPGSAFRKANPGAVETIARYNRVIDSFEQCYKNVRVLSVPASCIDKLTLEDGYHLNVEGHLYLSEALADIISGQAHNTDSPILEAK